MELSYNRLLLIFLWQYNHHGEEGLNLHLFEETFGKTQGSHYYDKWMNCFNRDLRDMVARQIEVYRKNRKHYGIY